MQSPAKIVAALGENSDFVAFQAHCWFAFALVYFVVGRVGAPLWITVGSVAAVALLKEFPFATTRWTRSAI